MPGPNLLQLVYQLELPQKLIELPYDDDDDNDFAEDVATLVNDTGSHLLTCLDELVCEDQSEANSQMLQLCGVVLNAYMPLLWRMAEHEYSVSEEVLPVLNELAQLLRKQSSGAAAAASSGFRVLDHVPQMLSVILRRIRYPDEFDHESAYVASPRSCLVCIHVGCVSHCSDDEDSIDFEVYRKVC